MARAFRNGQEMPCFQWSGINKVFRFRGESNRCCDCLPKFKWLKVIGQAGIQDLGLAVDSRLVVSERVLNALRLLGLSNAVIEDYGRATESE
jgi:hypothetical protein